MRLIIFLFLGMTSFVVSIFANQNSANSNYKILYDYVKAVRSVVINFHQKDTLQNIDIYGQWIIDENHNFRINYYPPSPFLIIGNKNNISIYDYDMETIVRLESKEYWNIFSEYNEEKFVKLFLINSISYVDDECIIKITSLNSDNEIQIKFSESKKNLISIEIKEINNLIIFTVQDIKKIISVDPKLFILKNPDVFGPPERLNKSHLKTRYELQHKK